jgi:hypothetical protein
MKKLKPQGRRLAVLLFSFMLALQNMPAYSSVSKLENTYNREHSSDSSDSSNSDSLIAVSNPENSKNDLVVNPDVSDDISSIENSNKVFSTEYSAITKKILLASIQLERFSLHYRRECLRTSKFRQLRYFAAQEAGAAGALTFEIMAINQFNIGRNHPLKLSTSALRGAFTTSLITSIIAGSGSALELGNDFLDALKHKRDGYDPGTAKKYVLAKLAEIDKLLTERENIVAANKEQPGYERAELEGQILNQLRNAFIEEFSAFNIDVRSYAAFRNCFYLFNIATNALAATAAGVGYRATKQPKLNGPTNILFIVTGAVAASSSLISNAASKYVAHHERRSFLNKVNNWQPFDSAKLSAMQKRLQELSAESSGTLMPSLPVTDRLAIYMQSGELFRKQMTEETAIMGRLNQVALQSSLLGPLVGGTFMTQGILGTIGYYKYTNRLRPQINHYYSGAIVGSVGASTELVGTAAWLVASLAYEHKLAKEKRLPRQLIAERLDHLDQLERTILSLH